MGCQTLIGQPVVTIERREIEGFRAMTYPEIPLRGIRATSTVAQRTYTHAAADRLVKVQVAGKTVQYGYDGLYRARFA